MITSTAIHTHTPAPGRRRGKPKRGGGGWERKEKKESSDGEELGERDVIRVWEECLEIKSSGVWGKGKGKGKKRGRGLGLRGCHVGMVVLIFVYLVKD